MAHEIEGNSAFFNSNKPAWHGLGVVLNDPNLTPEDAWKMAYPGVLVDGDLMPSINGATLANEYNADGSLKKSWASPHSKAILRVMPDGTIRHIADVGRGYTYPQPHTCFSFFEPYMKQGVVLEAGGSLNDGKRMWALGKLPGGTADVMNGADPVDGYLLVYTAFDGSLSHGIKFTPTRVVCANTLAMATGGRGAEIKLRHTKGLLDRIEDIKQDIDLAVQGFRHTVEYYKQIARKRMTGAQMAEYIMKLFAPDHVAGGAKEKEELHHKTQAKVVRVIELLDTQRGLDLVPAARGTAWQAYNAVTQYLTHDLGKSQDTRLNSLWFGESAALNKKALELAATI